MAKFADAIKALIIVNVILFVIPYLVPDVKDRLFETLALYFPENQHFEYWQFITTMFMHGSLAHIFFNMFALWSFGTPLEQMWGRNKFLVFYFVSGIGASLIYTLVNYYQFHSIYNELVNQGISSQEIRRLLETGSADDHMTKIFSTEKLRDFWSLFNVPAVGASGAIYGVLVAFGILFPNAKLALMFLPVPIAAKYFIPILIGLDLFSGITGFSIFGGGIAHFAHVGGAIIGLLLMLLWRKKSIAYDDVSDL